MSDNSDNYYWYRIYIECIKCTMLTLVLLRRTWSEATVDFSVNVVITAGRVWASLKGLPLIRGLLMSHCETLCSNNSYTKPPGLHPANDLTYG